MLSMSEREREREREREKISLLAGTRTVGTSRSPKELLKFSRGKKLETKMDSMGKNDLDTQMTVLRVSATDEEEEEDQNVDDAEVQDFSQSLREMVQEEMVKPKLRCLMMDPAFSMVTLQSEDSGIVWETASSRCSTPWASEISSPAPDLRSNSLVPRGPGSETAGKIVFIMDEDHMVRRKKRKRPNKVPERLPADDGEPGEPDRPAMVEVSVPNVTAEKGKRDASKDSKEARKQRVFCLVSEGSEILNIVVPPKVSTVDEEESKGLKDNLSYLEETPVIKAAEIPEEAEVSEETESLEPARETVQEVALPPTIKPVKNQGVCEDYFEKFTLLDRQAPSGGPTEDEDQEPETSSEQELYEGEDNAIDAEPATEAPDDSASVSGLEISGEHVDEVFYGAGPDPGFGHVTKGVNQGEEPAKCLLKKSGSALFGSQESILTPIFLPEGPQKIIDLVLLEEPKAMAFMYSDLYSEAVGSRTKQDDTESVTSEKSFHSQESELEDRGYLEKFVLKDETPVTPVTPLHHGREEEDGVGMWSQDAFGLTPRENLDSGGPDEEDEITDFFRNSASSSPCEPIRLCEVEPEETRPETKVRRVVFQDERRERTAEEVVDIAEAFLKLDVGTEASLEPTDYKSVIAEYAAKTRAAAPKNSPKTKPPKTDCIPVSVPQTVKPLTPHHKPFLELTPLLPVEVPEEDGPKEREGGGNVCPSTAVQEGDAPVEGQDHEQISQKETKGSASTGEGETGAGPVSSFKNSC